MEDREREKSVFSYAATALLWPRTPHCQSFEITHTDTPSSVGLPWISDQPEAEIFIPENTKHLRQKTMLPVGFEPASPVTERLQSHALDRAATGTGRKQR
jgi:hypothetical protein